jgi:hypothetical protein
MEFTLKFTLKLSLLKLTHKSHLFKYNTLFALERVIKELLALINYNINLTLNFTIYLTWGKLALKLI